jgi:hypothetical protein
MNLRGAYEANAFCRGADSGAGIAGNGMAEVPCLLPAYSPLSVKFCTDLHSVGRFSQDSDSATTGRNPRTRRAEAARFLGKTGHLDRTFPALVGRVRGHST